MYHLINKKVAHSSRDSHQIKCRGLPSFVAVLPVTEVCEQFYEREAGLWKVCLQTMSPEGFDLQKNKIYTSVNFSSTRNSNIANTKLSHKAAK